MSIGQFAEATGLSVSAVRFYANQGVLHPAEIDARSGYRRFAAAQVADGQLIRDLRRLEMPLPSIARALGLSADERYDLVQDHLAELAASVSRVHSIAQSLGTSPNKDTTMTIDQTHDDERKPNETAANGSVSLPARALGTALRQVLPVAGADPALPQLMTVLVEAKDGSLRVVATDRHRLAVRDLVPTLFRSDFSVVLAAATMADWQRLLDVDGDVSIETNPVSASLSGAVEASVESVPTVYPDYQTVLDTPAGVTTVTADAAAIGTTLVDRTGPTTLEFSANGLRVDLEGDAEAIAVATRHVGPPQSVIVNPSYLSTALAATVGPEVVIDIVDPLRPLVIRSADDGTFTTLVMPIAPE